MPQEWFSFALQKKWRREIWGMGAVAPMERSATAALIENMNFLPLCVLHKGGIYKGKAMQSVLSTALSLDGITIPPGSYTVSEIDIGGVPSLVLKAGSIAGGYIVSDTPENRTALGLPPRTKPVVKFKK